MHVPVLLNEVIDGFSSFKEKNVLVYFDGTFGRGGHYSKLKNIFNFEKTYATDQDLTAIKYANQNFAEVEISHENFFDFAKKNTNKIR